MKSLLLNVKNIPFLKKVYAKQGKIPNIMKALLLDVEKKKKSNSDLIIPFHST